MPVTITSVSGMGGNPPVTIQITGTVEGCEDLEIRCSCTQNSSVLAIPAGAAGSWSTTVPNDNGCSCGQTVTVSATCVKGRPDSSGAVQLPLECCPTAVLHTAEVGDCDAAGKRPVTLDIEFSFPLPAGSSLIWTWGDPALPIPLVMPIAAAGTTFSASESYSAGTWQPTVTVIVAGAPPCPSIPLGPITVPGCLPCPYLTLDAGMPQVTGCVPGSALVECAATLNWPGGGGAVWPLPSSYFWVVRHDSWPPGMQAEQTTAGGLTSSVTSANGWFDGPGSIGGTIAAGAIDLSLPGNYAISVSAQFPAGAGLPATCTPSTTQTFQVDACECPSAAADGAEWTVSGTEVPTAPNRFQTKACDQATTTITLNVDPGGLAPADLLYTWDFSDGAAPVSRPGPNGATQTHTFSNPAFGQAQTYAVTVMITAPSAAGCPPISRTLLITVPGCQPGETPPTQPGETPSTDGGAFNLCAGLLVAAMVLLTLGAILVLIGVCANIPQVLVIGIVVLVIGFVLLILWLILCATTTPCWVMQRVDCFLFFVISLIMPIVALILANTGNLPCGLAAALTWGGYGTIYTWLNFVMSRVGCPKLCS